MYNLVYDSLGNLVELGILRSMSEQYENDQDDIIEFVGHYDRFFKNISDPAINREVVEKEALISQRINDVRSHQLKMIAERERFAFINEGITHQEIIQSISETVETKNRRKKAEPEIPISDFVQKIFESILAKDKPLVDYLRFHSIQEFTTQNEYLTLCFIGVRSINLLSPIACIKEEQWIKGVKKSYDLYTKSLNVKPRSRYDAIQGLILKKIIFKKNFHDKKGIFYFLNTVNSKKIYDLVEKGKLNRDDLEKINELLNKRFLDSLDTQLVEKFIHYRSAKFADLSSEKYYSDQHYFHIEPANSADAEEDQNQTEIGTQNSLPIDHPKESPKVTSLDHDPDMTFGKIPVGDFSEDDQLKFLASRLTNWKKNQDDLNYLIENFSLSKVFNKTIELEEKSRTRKIKKIGSFYPYLKTVLLNDKLKGESKKSKTKAKNLADKNKTIIDEKEPDYISLFQIFDSNVNDNSIKSNWDYMANNFIDKLKASCNDRNEEFISESIPKIKDVIKCDQLQLFLLNGGLPNDEVEKIINFLSEN